MSFNLIIEELGVIAMGIIGVAILAVLVSRNAQTPAVIQATASGFSNSLATAISPVTGKTVAPNLSYPTGSNGFSDNFPIIG